MRTIDPRTRAAAELRGALIDDRGRSISGRTWPRVVETLAAYRAHVDAKSARRLDRYFDMTSEREFTHEGADRLIATLEREHHKTLLEVA